MVVLRNMCCQERTRLPDYREVSEAVDSAGGKTAAEEKGDLKEVKVEEAEVDGRVEEAEEKVGVAEERAGEVEGWEEEAKGSAEGSAEGSAHLGEDSVEGGAEEEGVPDKNSRPPCPQLRHTLRRIFYRPRRRRGRTLLFLSCPSSRRARRCSTF